MTLGQLRAQMTYEELVVDHLLRFDQDAEEESRKPERVVDRIHLSAAFFLATTAPIILPIQTLADSAPEDGDEDEGAGEAG